MPRNGRSCADFTHQLIEAQALDLGHAIANRANTGKHHAIGFADHLGIAGHQHLACPYVLKGLGHRVQVAHAVINYRNGLHLQAALGRRHLPGHTRIQLNRHAQRAAEGFEHRFDLVVGVGATQVVDVHADQGMVDEALEELLEQIHVEAAHHWHG